MTRRRLEATEYTVGWVCALPIELAAAQEMLDEEHEALPQDNNDLYTLGRIGNHNVVLVCLPAGQLGIGPAAAGATRMMSKFKSIRFGLMVGVGGGVPSVESDIRLGDVVVSQPYKEHSGVVQYDSGKTGRDGHISRTGSLNAPPKVLLNAVSQLRANQYRNKSTFATNMTIFNRLPRFSRGMAGPDVLFEATYNHRGGATCEQCNKEAVIHRLARGIEDEVIIHYGTIASGSQVMKDGITRDQLSAELGGVLCFEMEAAGLMNDFPCLVIRGICDYADSHKNKTWQPYAAATAAACAKEILSLVPEAEAVTAEVATAEAVGETRKYRIPFSLKGVPLGKFAERPQDTAALERALLPRKQVNGRRMLVLYGMGGAGKTQLAAAFSLHHQHDFSSVLWLDGSSKSNLKQSIAMVASRIPVGQIPEASRMYTANEGGDINAVIKDVLSWLSIPGNSNWLVVVDNVDRDYQRHEEDIEAYDIDAYLPEAYHGSVLITTRLPHLGQLGERWEVKKVDEERARAIFEKWYGREIGCEGDELLGLLDGLPLALSQAAAYIGENMTSFQTYTRLYKEHWKDLMEPRDGKHMPLRSYANGSVATTWSISYTAIRAKNEAAANLLLLWAHLDNKSLWHDLLATASHKSAIAAERTTAYFGDMAWKEMEFIEAIRMLRSYSLVEGTADQVSYATHPVVHQWALHIQDEKQRAELSWLAIVLVGFAMPRIADDNYWEMQIPLIPHAERCKKRIKKAMEDGTEQHKVNEKQEETITILMVVHNIGILYLNQKRLEEAEEMLMWARQEKEKVLGAQHPSTLQSVIAHAAVYEEKGRLEEAEEMYLRVLERYDKTPAAHHNTLLPEIVHSLASLYQRQGRLDEAKVMYERAPHEYEKALGLEHVATLETVHNLANFYKDQGWLGEAEAMYERTLRGYEKALGPGHTKTLNVLNSFANLYKDQGRLDESEAMYERVLRGYKKAVNPEILLTFVPALRSLWGLGSLYHTQNRVEDAKAFYSEALSGHQKAYGSNHRDCQALLRNIANLDLRKYEIKASSNRAQVKEHVLVPSVIHENAKQNNSASRGLQLLEELGWKQT